MERGGCMNGLPFPGDDLRCVYCSGQDIVLSEKRTGYSCPACGAIHPLVDGMPFFGKYAETDIASLMEITAVAAAIPDKGNIDFSLWEKVCAAFHGDGDMEAVRAALGASAEYFPHRYGEWEMWRVLLRGIDLVGAKVLDVGAGEGFDAWRLVRKGAAVTALEYNSALAAVGRHRLPEIRWIGGFSHVLPFRDETFDVVVCNAALHHMLDIPAAIGEFLRVLKPGGRFLTAADSFAGGDTAASSLSIFDSHPAVLAGVNETVPAAMDFLAQLKRHRRGLDVEIYTIALSGKDALGLPGDYLRLWTLPEAETEFARHSGVIALRVRKKRSLDISAAVHVNGWLGADEFKKVSTDKGCGIAFMAGRVPGKYRNLVTPHRWHDKFLQLNGWRIPRGDDWQEGWGRVNSFWTRNGSDASLEVTVEAPSHGFSGTVGVAAAINGETVFTADLLRGAWHRLRIPVADIPAASPFLLTLTMPQTDDFMARIIRIKGETFSVAAAGPTSEMVGEGSEPGLHAILAARFPGAGELGVICLPGRQGLAQALSIIRGSPRRLRFLVPEPMVQCLAADIGEEQSEGYRLGRRGLWNAVGSMPPEYIILLPGMKGKRPGWLRALLRMGAPVLDCAANTLVRRTAAPSEKHRLANIAGRGLASAAALLSRPWRNHRAYSPNGGGRKDSRRA